MASKSKGKIFVFILLITVFFVWYFFIYTPRQRIRDNLLKTNTGKFYSHILWGYPIAENVRIFEYEGYVSGYDTIRLNPIWVSYYINKDFLNGKKYLRNRKFAPDPSLNIKHSAVDSDFRNSGFDRGHLARQSNMKGRSPLCETQSLYFTNISPQKPNFNRKTWNNLEMAVDDLTEHYGQSWIITGPYFDKEREFINRRVEIPDGFYKIVVLNTEKGLYPLAFLLDMDDNALNIEDYCVTIDSVESLTGVDFFHELEDISEENFESLLLSVPHYWRK